MTDQLAHYELLAPLGAGGMGEVYRARDTRLDREVAIKILPEALAKDPERIARFDREAKTLASLQHPNVATVHDFMTLDGKAFLVMELVEGEDLSVRLERGAIEADEARQIAIQLAAGLEAAHERNIVHRDLKPANVKLTPDGQVKILDFGLARAVTGEPEDGSDPMLSPTITQAMTQAGTILGTAAYMSPEQARGKRVDKRADIWAFGVLVFEMLTGERLFEGETTSDTLASVLKNPVDFDQLQDVPPDIVWVLQRCLDRNPTRRLRDIGEARLVLSGESTVSQIGTPAATLPDPKQRSWWWPLLAGMLAVALVATVLTRPKAPEEPLVRASIPLPDGVSLVLEARQPGPPVLSPDGSAVVFSAQREDGHSALWYRRIDSPEARELERTEDGSYPFWSPDGKSIGYLTDHALMRLDLGTGSPLRLADAQFGKGGTWSEQGQIVFSSSYNRPLSAVLASGGERPRQVTTLDSIAGENSHRHPFFLPDGQHFLYLARGAADSLETARSSVRVGSLDGTVQRTITGATGHAEFHHGFLLLAREGALVAQPFDTGALQLGGVPRIVVPGVESLGAASRTLATVSNDGRMLYVVPRPTELQRALTSFDREGRIVRELQVPVSLHSVVLSPDGRRAATIHGELGANEQAIWIVDLESGTTSRFAGGGDEAGHVAWSPDGRHLAFARRSGNDLEIAVRLVDGGAQPAVVLSLPGRQIRPESWSPSGRYLSFTYDFGGIGVIELDSSLQPVGEPRVIVGEGQSRSITAWGSSFLGNDEWIVYHASEGAEIQLYVSNIHNPSRRLQITSAGGVYPSFDPQAGEICWVETGVERLAVMSIRFRSPESDPILGTAESLYRLPVSDLEGSLNLRGGTVTFAYSGEGAGQRDILFVSDWRKLLRN